MSTLTTDDLTFARKLIEASIDHTQWVNVMRFGMDAMLHAHPGFVFAAIVSEAERINAAESTRAERSETFEVILRELGLQLRPL